MKVNSRGRFRIGVTTAAGLMLVLLPGCSEEESPKVEKGAKADEGEKQEPVAPVAPVAKEGDAGVTPAVEPSEDGAPEEGVVEHAVRWTDEVGNFIKFRDNSTLVNPDIIAVDALSKDGNLVVVYRFDPGNLEKCIAQKGGDPPLHFGASISELHLDLDNDPGTGAKLGEAENEQGYELKFSVMTGFSFVDAESGKADAMFGDVGIPDNLTNLKADASQVTWILDPKAEARGTWSKMSSEKRDAEVRRLTVLGKDLVAIYVPYDWFGMKSGDVIRVAFTDEKSVDDEMTEALRVKLK